MKDAKLNPPKLAPGERFCTVSFVCNYCESCRHFSACEKQHGRTIYVQGAFPWDCIFCRDKAKGYKPTIFAGCPRARHSGPEEGHKGCPKLDGDGRATFCDSGVCEVHVYPDGLCHDNSCDRYDFDPFAADSVCIWGETYSYGLKHKCIRQTANDNQWLTLADMLDNIRYDMLCAATKRRSTASVAWDYLAEVADVYGWINLGPSFARRDPEAQTLRVRRTAAWNVYIKRAFDKRQPAAEEGAAK